MLRRVAGQPAPAAADIEQALARRQLQLAADQVELGLLSRVEIAVPAVEHGRRILHLAPQEQRVEGVRDIVVKLDHAQVVAPASRQPAHPRGKAHARFCRRPRGEERYRRAQDRRLRSTERLSPTAFRVVPALQRIERAGAGDVEIARQIDLDQRRQARRAQQPADGPGRADADADIVARIGRPGAALRRSTIRPRRPPAGAGQSRPRLFEPPPTCSRCAFHWVTRPDRVIPGRLASLNGYDG